MIARPWETDLTLERDELPPVGPRLRDQTSPIGQILGQNLLDEAVRALQEDLAMLQAEQERSLNSVSGQLQLIGVELSGVRTQLMALAEPLLLAQTSVSANPSPAEPEPERQRERAESELRFERLEKQVALLVRGLDSLDGLRYQSDVHTRALARLTDLLGEVVRPKPVEGLEELRCAVLALEAAQQRRGRLQLLLFSALGLGLTPGLVALGWMLLQYL